MIRLILGRAGAGKTARVLAEIADEVRAGRGGIVFLVPEQYSHEAERELCRAAGDAMSLYGEVLSFTGLARKVFAECGGGTRAVMDGGGRLLCMAVAAQATAGRLRAYNGAVRDARLLDGLLRAVTELSGAGIDAAALEAASARADGELAPRLGDLALLMEAYEAARARAGADPAEVLRTLAGLIGDSLAVRGRFYIDGFSDFTALEREVLRALLRAGADMTFCLTCARDEEAEVFSLCAGTARWLRRAAAEYGQEVREQWLEPEDGSALGYFCEHLFDFSQAAEAPPADGSIRLVEAADMYEECELAAAYLAELARGGARWRELAVAARGFSDYRAALESACERYGVPLFISGRGDMLQKSVPALISSALKAALRGYEYEAVFGYLKTGLTPVPAEGCDRLENYVILWNIRGGMWKRPFSQHPEGYNRAFDDETRARLEGLNALRELAAAPLERLEAAAKGAETARAQARALADFLVDIRLPERLQTRAEELDAAGRSEAAAEYERLWDIVCAALEQFAAVLGDMPMDAERFRSLFCLMLSKYDSSVIPVSLDRVQAGDFDGMRRRHIGHLIVLGASDGRLPAPEEGGGLFTPEQRDELSALGLDLGGAQEDFSRELWRIYSCLSLPSEGLYMSWPLTDADGAEARPSMVAERARAIFGLTPERGDLTRARTFSERTALALAVRAHAGGGEPMCLAARDWLEETGRGGEAAALAAAAERDRGRLSPAAVRALYGDRPALSATRAERFGECRFAYFLQYGLRAKPRQRAVFDPRDYGTFMHYVLENVGRGVMERGGFRAVTRAELNVLTDACVDRYISERLDDFADKSARFTYLFSRLRGTVRQVTEDMWQELRASRFQPLDIELDLAAPGALDPAADDGVRLTGRADRVDGWVRDGVLYLRVTDYKTGVKRFSLSDVCDGMDMQLLLYLFTLERRGKGRYGVEEIRPAGVLYAPARVDLVRTDADVTDEELAALRRASARRSGLVLDDGEVIEAMEPGEDKRFLPIKLTGGGDYTKTSREHLATLERFGALGRYIDKTLRDMAAELRAGSVAADPWFRSARENACAWCQYRSACMFDEGRERFRVRTRLTPAEAWERIEKEHD